jgi:hypothetical protein
MCLSRDAGNKRAESAERQYLPTILRAMTSILAKRANTVAPVFLSVLVGT